jgi:hypothetical protein
MSMRQWRSVRVGLPSKHRRVKGPFGGAATRSAEAIAPSLAGDSPHLARVPHFSPTWPQIIRL